MKKKKNVKLILTLIVVLFIPVAAAGIILYQNLQAGLFSGTVKSCEVVFSDGEKVLYEDEKSVALFMNAVKSGENSSLAETDLNKPLAKYESFQVDFQKTNESYRYTFYVSAAASDCLYTAPEETVIRHIRQEEAQAILNLEPVYARVMEFVSRPEASLTLQNGSSLPAKSCEGSWIHVSFDGSKEEEAVSVVSEEKTPSLPSDELFEVTMPLKPDYANMRILDESGSQLWSGKPEEFRVLPISTEQVFTVLLDCDWYENRARAYQGHLEFVFELFYDRPVTHSVSADALRPGKTLTITLSHTQSENISVTCTFPAGEIRETKDGYERKFEIPVSEEASAGEFAVLILGTDVDLNLPVTILPAV